MWLDLCFSENIKIYLKEKEPGLSETPISSADEPAPDVTPVSHAGHAAQQDLGGESSECNK